MKESMVYMGDKPNHPIKVLLVDDDADWLKAVESLLSQEEDILVAATAACSEKALALAATAAFDVAVIDIHLRGSELDGIGLAYRLNERIAVKTIMLTSLNDERTITKAFTAGALQYLEKTSFKELPQAIRTAYHHSAPMEVLLKELARLKREEQLQGLTNAEREVYELIEAGYTQPQMEKKLFKAESTLKNQVNKMLKKLGARSSKEAVAKVKRRGVSLDQHTDDKLPDDKQR